MENSTVEILEFFINPFYFRVFKNDQSKSNKVYKFIHGWSGNEKSMSIFTSAISEYKYVIFPRGPLKIAEDQYSWVDIRNNAKPDFRDYADISTKLETSFNELQRYLEIPENDNKINLIGFSQGAAISAVLSILQPQNYSKIALLSGFLPTKPPSIEPGTLENIQYYIAHGTQDKLVEINKAIKLKEYLEGFGAKTVFCEEELGHKIGSTCLKNLKKFFQSEEITSPE